MAAIKKETLQFLTALHENNNRDWFNANKDSYVAANENFIGFIESVINEIAAFDKSVAEIDAKKAVFRIYRDTRFAKDKSPYKTNFGAALMMTKGKVSGVAGYYLHLQPGHSFLVGGVHMPEPAVLKAIRAEISYHPDEFLQIINNETFKTTLELKGEKLAKVPQGFEKDDLMAEYLKFKALTLYHPVTDQQILAEGFAAYCAGVFKIMVPFNIFINRAVGVQH